MTSALVISAVRLGSLVPVVGGEASRAWRVLRGATEERLPEPARATLEGVLAALERFAAPEEVVHCAGPGTPILGRLAVRIVTNAIPRPVRFRQDPPPEWRPPATDGGERALVIELREKGEDWALRARGALVLEERVRFRLLAFEVDAT